MSALLPQREHEALAETHEREVRLVELQASVEKMTRWLVRLTIMLGLIGIAGIAASVWAILA